MRKITTICLLSVVITNTNAQSTIPTTTVNGSLRITDSLQVTNDIRSTGDISISGNMNAAAVVASGEVTATDTMRAKKDVLVDGNAVIGGELRVTGMSSFNAVSIQGPLSISTASMATINPCIKLLIAESSSNSLTANVTALSGVQATLLDQALDANPCPTPPIIPFTWQTYGNHVNSNNRWIGTIENFDFNIRTNNKLRMMVKNNGAVNIITDNTNVAESFMIKNSSINKSVFEVRSNGATFIGTQKVNSRPNSLLTVSGELDCRSLFVLKPTNWSDKVFNASYNLPTLEEVETYINTNKHLPNVKSEADIMENGYDVNDTDAMLLEKIENLYLYIIKQQKEINELKTKMNKQ